jgi:hypothetical protein
MADKPIAIPPELLARAENGEVIIAMSPCQCGSPCGSVLVAVLNTAIVAVADSDRLAVAFKIPGALVASIIDGLQRHSAEAGGR